jgi:hypothetical protein
LSQGTVLKSFTELRATGGSKRFVDYMGYLLEGLKATEPIGIRRSSAVELSRHLADTDFIRKLNANGLIGRVYEQLRRAQAGEGDKASIFLSPSSYLTNNRNFLGPRRCLVFFCFFRLCH